MALTNADLQAIASLISQNLEPLNGRLDKIEDRLEKVNSRLDKVDSRLDKIDSRLDKVDIELDKLNSQVSALKSGQIELRKELKEINIKVSNTYDLALDAWGTSTENRKWLESIN